MNSRNRKSPYRLIRLVVSETYASFLSPHIESKGGSNVIRCFIKKLNIARMFFNKKDFVTVVDRTFKVRICKRRDLNFFL